MAVIPSRRRCVRTGSSWLRSDVLAGVTLAAVAIPETMGYTSIARVPVVTGLYTILFPALAFALLGSSRLLVVGADSATAAILASGLAAMGIAGLVPDTPQWLALTSLTALVCGALLLLARLLRLGFLGDFLSASVLIGFLTGVGIQVFAGQIPDMLGISKGSGNWFEQQWYTLTHLGGTSLPTLAFAIGTLALILGSRGSRRRCRAPSWPWCCRSSCRRRCRCPLTGWRSSGPFRAASRRSGCPRASAGPTSPVSRGSPSRASCSSSPRARPRRGASRRGTASESTSTRTSSG